MWNSPSHIILLIILPSYYCLSLSEIRNIFGNNYCIPGTLSSIKDSKTTKLEEYSNPIYSVNDMIDISHDKSAMSSINELAQYNDLKYSYELMNEQGPAHNKVFDITLYLGDEQFNGRGKSLKLAQREAATLALKSTQYEHPPLKIKEDAKADTPVALLNNLSTKLGLPVKYTTITDLIEEINDHDSDTSIRPKETYIQKLNDSINDTIRIRKDGSDTKGPFKVKVEINGKKFIGEALTIRNAKNEAAVKALMHLKEDEDSLNCLKNDDGCKSQRQGNKSPISLVYEAAQKRNLPVSFEVIDEVGLSHAKMFTTKCVVGELESTGSGKSKKESKKEAAQNMIPDLMQIPEVKGQHTNVNLNSKKSKKKNKNKVVKTTFDKIDRMFDDVVDFGKSLLGKMQRDDESKDHAKMPKKKDNKQMRSPSKEILLLGNHLEIEMQYNDFNEEKKNIAILSLGTKPPFLCLGEGISRKNSRDLAAKHGLEVLYKLGLLDNLVDKSGHISGILDNEEHYQKIILEVVKDGVKETKREEL